MTSATASTRRAVFFFARHQRAECVANVRDELVNTHSLTQQAIQRCARRATRANEQPRTRKVFLLEEPCLRCFEAVRSFARSSHTHEHDDDEATDESTCKPDSVLNACTSSDGHPSRPVVADRFLRSTRRLGRAALERLRKSDCVRLFLDLAPGGVYRAAPVARNAGGLLHRRFTLTDARAPAVCFLWHCPAGHPGLSLATTLPCGVRTFLGAPAAAGATRPSGRLVRRASMVGEMSCKRPAIASREPPSP